VTKGYFPTNPRRWPKSTKKGQEKTAKENSTKLWKRSIRTSTAENLNFPECSVAASEESQAITKLSWIEPIVPLAKNTEQNK